MIKSIAERIGPFTDLKQIQLNDSKNDTTAIEAILKDYWICKVSRETSLLARKEVLTGKAKFGITGDGKELPQLVLSRFFNKGDFRSGYYRDQTIVMAQGICSVEDFFAQLYADTENDPFSGGRQMNNHFATRSIDDQDNWLDLTEIYNNSSDIAPTAGQMARALGLALASKKFRNIEALHDFSNLSNNGNEVVFCNIGDASTSEGVFWETLNAAAVIKVPLVVSVWDDGYGISVPKELQTAKASISEACSGFLVDEDNNGIYIYNVKGWDYVSLNNVYDEATRMARTYHMPVLVHVEELTQPQGHSTSGSHERYKSKERLDWEKEYDCLVQFENWIISTGIATQEMLDKLGVQAKEFVKQAKKKAWSNYTKPASIKKNQLLDSLTSLGDSFLASNDKYIQELRQAIEMPYEHQVSIVRKIIFDLKTSNQSCPEILNEFISESKRVAKERFHSHLYSESDKAAVNHAIVFPEYDEESPQLNGYQIINKYFDQQFANNSTLLAFGEDVGNIGDVNQGFAGLQEKYGQQRIFDTGIREWTIIGQAIGLAMRGLRPIAEIQYLDYLLYGLTPLSDDLATVRYRTKGMQMAPAIIRTRGHRLEGIWHSGSPMGMIINSLRGMCVCVPRNFVQAAGMYQTLINSTDPALVIEPLAGYRLKEKLPSNLGEYSVPMGVPEVLIEGTDITIVSYGMCLKIISEAANILAEKGIHIELIDVQTFLPFDLEGVILKSIMKTNRLMVVDEDVPGGASAFIIQQLLEEKGAYFYLDSQPITLTGKDHRPPYGDEGDYFSKPNMDDVLEAVFEIIHEAEPSRFNKK